MPRRGRCGTIEAMSLSRSVDVTTRYARILGFAYQVLGDAALAAQAANTVCLRYARSGGDDRAFWREAVTVLHDYLARGFVVRPLLPEGQHAALLSALHRLEPAERMIVLLRYHEGLTIPDLEAVMAIEQATIRRVLAQARGSLLDWTGVRDAV
jgi:hypothetical protein